MTSDVIGGERGHNAQWQLLGAPLQKEGPRFLKKLSLFSGCVAVCKARTERDLLDRGAKRKSPL